MTVTSFETLGKGGADPLAQGPGKCLSPEGSSPCLALSSERLSGRFDWQEERVLPVARSLPASVSRMLANGEPDMHPDHREEQLQWARSRLYADRWIPPYRTIVCCRAVIMLSRDQAEIDACQRIKLDAERAYTWGDKTMKPSIAEWAEQSVLLILLAIICGLLWVTL